MIHMYENVTKSGLNVHQPKRMSLGLNMDRLLQLESPLFYDEVAAIHKKVYESVRALEESSFSWMDGILDDARNVFNQSDIFLLPKTPSAKQKGRRRKKSTQSARRKIQVVEDQDDYVPQQDENKVEKSPAGRRTRAASRAATTSRARNTRIAKNTRKNKSKSQEPVLNIEQNINSEKEQLNITPKQIGDKNIEEQDSSIYEVTTETWTQSADQIIKVPQNNESVLEEQFVVEETWIQSASKNIAPPEVFDSVALKLTNAKTPIRNFSVMNVKEKVHAYEEIILISPITSKSMKRSVSHGNSNSPKTPPNQDTISHKTPDTVVNTETINLKSAEIIDVEDESNTPVSKTKKGDTRLSQRRSVAKSLKVLPSTAKMQSIHAEAETKPTRTRTRLRLKKKEQKTEHMESDLETATSEDSMETDSQDSVEENTETVERYTARRTRSHGKERKENEIGQIADQCSHLEKEETCQFGDNTEQEEVTYTPTKVVRSTRTKTRLAQNQHMLAEAEKTSNKDSGVGGSSSSMDGDGTPRATRSKIRKPKTAQIEVTGSDSALASPAAPRVTRTKTRKRQHEEESDSEQGRPKRSCTSNSSVDTGRTKMAVNEESSEDEVVSPPCPVNKVVRPIPSFLNSLNKNSHNPIRPANLHTGGLVKSFISRNSPAPKPTLKEIQDKRKQELHEKERKEKERLKKREEEHKKKMEEMRKKREEKMKKVQEMRELRQQQEKENRLQIERRLAEKRQLTQKIREEKIKEDKEKQKLRLQKMEEAEERRKQDEEGRLKKLHEQREQEKFHEEMLHRRKEFEEQERLQKIEDEKRRAAERQQEIEREREKERERLMKIEEEKKKEWQKKKEERERQAAQERVEKEKVELEKKREREIQMKKEMERIREQERLRLAEQEKVKEQQRKHDEEIKKMVNKHNNQVQQNQNKQLPKPNMNRTHSLEEATVPQNTTNNDSYEMTPKRVPMASTVENYGIDDLNSGDETDDDECPRKKIPDWAQGSQLKTLLIKQHYHPPNLDELFDVIEAPDLNVLFEKKKARFNKRTSSAHWDSPILKPGLLGRM
ncbi:inner centromere protein A-like isoform X2 [Mercenaria mercenaria]|uniref:inner centromere protein A-like isoform X2 n=1 Tax=Mercenaria mercenaria TaxID=6596 RepID=UPI00234EAA15|nr:inner centromere protein A-like isoform X2 [Mercenaria mercenaria]